MDSNNSNEGVRRQRSPKEIIRLLEEYENSEGVSVKEFCAMIGVSDAAFYGWRKMYGTKSEAKEKQTGFFELVTSEKSPLPNTLFAEVNGIKLYQPVAADYLKALAQ